MKPVQYLACLILPFAAFSCGMKPVDHQIPTKINVERERASTRHSLYQHHDIMLGGEKFNDAFGMVADAKVLINGYEALLLQEPTPAETKQEGNTATSEWKKRVYPKSQWTRTTVFEISGVDPKQNATRPCWTGDPEVKQRCQKPLRQREISRIGPDGKVTRSYRRPGSVN
ncbi:MAG: hypothetical protein H8E15_15345 [Planctomycetes bacterium]|nr:hypothetical protein [Planctomycetota bacterium]